jgi:hypothetical protein
MLGEFVIRAFANSRFNHPPYPAMSARSFHRLSNRFFALRAAWCQQAPVRVQVSGGSSTRVISRVPVIIVGDAPSQPVVVEAQETPRHRAA